MKLATCQMPDTQHDLAATINQISTMAQKAASQDVQLLVFPECYLQGYTANDEALARSRALNLSSPEFNAILQQLTSCQPVLVVGLIEIEDDILFNTAVVIDHGKLIGRYRKTHPNEKFFQAGTEYPVFTVSGMKFGINICYDANFPEAAAKLADQGAEIILYPLNNMLRHTTAERWKDKHIENLIARAKQTGAWIVSADVVGQKEGAIAYGCSAIINPNGQPLVQVAELQPGLAIMDTLEHTGYLYVN
jgi:predicted amidohydrolase